VYLFYQPDLDYRTATALNLQLAERLGKDKKKLVFAPMKYLDQEHLKHYNIDYCQLPFEIYKFRD
jgi:adenine-specific DNA-methyltransferase